MGVVGLVANPASARDIRRLVADGSAVTTHDKLNIVRRVLAGLGSVGVERVLSMQDGGGISAGLASMVDRPSADTWPEVAFVDHPVTQTAVDTVSAVTSMVRAGVGAIVVIGGLITSTLLTLVLLPVIYEWMETRVARPVETARQLESQEV